MNPRIPIAAITDEFSRDLPIALDAMLPIGMDAVELRVLFGRNIMDLGTDDLNLAQELLAARKMHVIGIASPLLKCVLPGVSEVDASLQQDVFASKHTFEDQPRLTDNAFGLAKRFGAKIVRVFSYWRTVEPGRCFDAVARALSDLADKAAKEGLTVGLENEHACNIATATESARILEAVQHPNLQLVWDPANCLVSGEDPFPGGYALLPKNRIAHVHAKDCHMDGHKPVFGPLGTRHVDWKGQIAALIADDYPGYISLETHWPGPSGDKLLASTICGWNLRGLSAG